MYGGRAGSTDIQEHIKTQLVCGGSIVDDLLFYELPIVCGGSVIVFVLVCITLCPF